MNPVIPLGLGTGMLLLCLFAMGAFYLCEPLRRDDDQEELERADEPDQSRRALLAHLKLIKSGCR